MQTRDHNQLDFLTAAMPPEVWTLSAELQRVDQLLDDPRLLESLLTRLDPDRGRPSLPATQILRLFYLKERYQLSDRVLLQEVADSFHWRRFCHFGVADSLPHPTSLTYWRKRLGPMGIQELNATIVQQLREQKIVRGRRFRMDSTVIEANIHHPTDSGLIADGIRHITRQVRRLQSLAGDTAQHIRNRTRTVTKTVLALGKLLKRRTNHAQDDVRKLTEALAVIGEQQQRRAQQIVTRIRERLQTMPSHQRKRATRLLHRISQTAVRVQRVVAQSRAASEGERISDRVVSMVDGEARPIIKGKLGQRVQFGYKVQIMEAEQGFVTHYTVDKGNPSDTRALLPALDHHATAFGRSPQIVATDRGYFSAANERECQVRGIQTISLPQRGKKSAQRRQQEHRAAFRRAQRWRAGGEATISRLKRKYGLRRSRYWGYEAVTLGVGLGIWVHNIRRWSQYPTK